jgi:hypothetical protein
VSRPVIRTLHNLDRHVEVTRAAVADEVDAACSCELGFSRGACRVQPYRLMPRVEKTMPEPEIVAQLAKRSRRRKPEPDVPRNDEAA